MTSPAPQGEWGRFDGAVRAEFLADGREMRLLEDFVYHGPDNKRWVSPKDSHVDGASIPRLLWTLIGSPFTGKYRDASVIHDVACVERKDPWPAVHLAFYTACRCRGVGELKAKVMYGAVYHFGPRWGAGAEVAGIPITPVSLQQLVAFVESANPPLADIESFRPRSIAAIEILPRTPDPSHLLRQIGSGPGVVQLESNTTPAQAAERTAEALRSDDERRKLLRRLRAAFERADRDAGAAPDDSTRALRDRILSQAGAAMESLGGNHVPADEGQRLALEALVQLTGRPSILVKNDDLDIDPADPDLGNWQGRLVLGRSLIKQTIASVGRIDSDGVHIGTGWVVAPGLVMTNRHVLQELGREVPAPGGPRWELTGEATIDFLQEHRNAATRRFRIESVVFAGPDYIGMNAQPSSLDLAILKVERKNADGIALPPALVLAKDQVDTVKGGAVYAVGYPGPPGSLLRFRDERDEQITEALQRIFRLRFEKKRVAFGLITHTSGIAGSPANGWVIGHDATTLGGSSGSCVVAFNGDNRVLGLHFGGDYLDKNLAHVLTTVSQLTAEPLNHTGITWQ